MGGVVATPVYSVLFGMLFVIIIPTAEYEQQVVYGVLPEEPSSEEFTENAEKHIGNRPAPRVLPTTTGKVRPRVGHPVVLRSGKVIKEEIPLEKLVEELLARLEVNNAIWCLDKEKHYFQVIFCRDAGDETENCLHALKEAGVGVKLSSIVSVSPSSVYEVGEEDSEEELEEDQRAWKQFVDSVRSKLTVAEVVDGVKTSAELSFDFLLLLLTANTIAAVSLIESDAVNMAAAMLVSPLMSPIVAMAFGAAISDFDLIVTGAKTVFCGMCVSWIYGFIFGLLLSTTAHPWGLGDWPTNEMITRGNTRSLWIGALWALPSGTGVALALLQGSAGPLIGVAISASLMPPIVNCAMLWALTCMKIYYGEKLRIPHLEGEHYNETYFNTSYKPLYYNHLPYELSAMGAISFCLFLVNFGCICATALVVLKIKEISAPYTSSVDLRRFWETDIKVAREYNRASMKRRSTIRKQSRDYIPEASRKSNIPEESLGEALEAAMREAMDDATFRKIKRCSYGPRSEDVIGQLLGKVMSSGSGSKQERKSGNDPAVMEQLLQALLAKNQANAPTPQQAFNRMSRRSMRRPSVRGRENRRSSAFSQGNASGNLPTIMERNSSAPKNNSRPLSLSERAANTPLVRNILQTMANAPQRLNNDEPLPRRGSRFGRRNSESTSLMSRGQP